jgi:hypothetical protein
MTSIGQKSYVTVEWIVESQYKAEHENLSAEAIEKSKTSSLEAVLRSHMVKVFFPDGTTTEAYMSRENLLLGAREGDTVVFVRREDFLAARGYNSQLTEDRWAHMDFGIRLQHMGLHQVRIGNAIRLSRTSQSQRHSLEKARSNRMASFLTECLRLSQGQFYGTFVNDVAEWHGSPVPDLSP